MCGERGREERVCVLWMCVCVVGGVRLYHLWREGGGGSLHFHFALKGAGSNKISKMYQPAPRPQHLNNERSLQSE